MNRFCSSPVPRTNTPRPAAAPSRRTFIWLAIALLGLSARAEAQTPQPTPPADEEVLTVRTDFVTIPVYVTDSHRRRVSGLTAQDFLVRDDGRPTKLSYFAAGTARVALLFALDASGSAREHIARQREAATAMLSRFGSGSRAAVLLFADRPTLALPFTDETAQVRAAFAVEAQRNRHTAIFDAALAAVRVFDREGGAPAERRIVVLLSDGLDTASTTRPRVVVQEAQARGVSIYVVHFPLYFPSDGKLTPRPSSRGFRDLAEQTGGSYFLLGDARQELDPRAGYDLAPVFRAIAEDLQSQYVLGFYLDEAARVVGEHKLDVTLAKPQRTRLRVQSLRERYTVDP